MEKNVVRNLHKIIQYYCKKDKYVILYIKVNKKRGMIFAIYRKNK